MAVRIDTFRNPNKSQQACERWKASILPAASLHLVSKPHLNVVELKRPELGSQPDLGPTLKSTLLFSASSSRRSEMAGSHALHRSLPLPSRSFISSLYAPHFLFTPPQSGQKTKVSGPSPRPQRRGMCSPSHQRTCTGKCVFVWTPLIANACLEAKCSALGDALWGPPH